LLEKNNGVSFLYSWFMNTKFKLLSKTLLKCLKGNLFYHA